MVVDLRIPAQHNFAVQTTTLLAPDETALEVLL
jgi:hypothetical protein